MKLYKNVLVGSMLAGMLCVGLIAKAEDNTPVAAPDTALAQKDARVLQIKTMLEAIKTAQERKENKIETRRGENKNAKQDLIMKRVQDRFVQKIDRRPAKQTRHNP